MPHRGRGGDGSHVRFLSRPGYYHLAWWHCSPSNTMADSFVQEAHHYSTFWWTGILLTFPLGFHLTLRYGETFSFRHLVQEKQQARAQGFSSNLVEQMRGRDSLASEGWEGKGSWEEVEGKKQEILRAQNHFRASRDGSISGPLNLVLLNCHHFKNLLPAILRQNVSNILQKFSKNLSFWGLKYCWSACEKEHFFPTKIM